MEFKNDNDIVIKIDSGGVSLEGSKLSPSEFLTAMANMRTITDYSSGDIHISFKVFWIKEQPREKY